MKIKIVLFALSALCSHAAFSQLMPFGFMKNCMGMARTTVTDELKKKHFLIKERDIKTAENPLLVGATYYSNSDNKAEGEIAVLSNIGEKNVTEITFKSGSKNSYNANYDDVYNQTVNFFKKETTVKSTRYPETNVTMFNKDGVYYYFYKFNNIPTIVVSNYKIDKDYFTK